MSYPEMMAVPLVGDVSPIKMLNIVVLSAHKNHKKWTNYYYGQQVHMD